MDDKIIIDESLIQAEAEVVLERELTRAEYLDVICLMGEDMFMLIQDKINQVVEHNALLMRNRGAEKVFPHFMVFYRNTHAFQHEFERSGTFKSEEDARAFIRHDSFLAEFEEWRIIQVEEGGAEKEITKTS